MRRPFWAGPGSGPKGPMGPMGPGPAHVAGTCPCHWPGPIIWAWTHRAKVFTTEAKKNILGAESGPRRSSGRFQRAFGVIFRCGSDGTILRTPKSIFFCFTTEARPYLIGRCHIFVASINVYEIGPSDSFLGQPFEQVSQGQNRHMVFSRKQPYPSPAEHTICL